MKKTAFHVVSDVLAQGKKIGDSLRIARKRRGYTQNEVASRLGISRDVVSNAEKGLSVSTHGLFSLLWLYGLLNQMADSVSDSMDAVGLSISRSQLPVRVRKKMVDDDF